MAFEYLTNVPLEEARATYLAALRQAGLSYKTETIPTSTALGRVTANAVYARISSPHYNACAMDGSPWMRSKHLELRKPRRRA